MKIPTTVNEFIDAAADYMDEHGWNRDGNYAGPEGQVCIYGATSAAYMRLVNEYDVSNWYLFKNLCRQADSLIRERIFTDKGVNPIEWNDNVAASKEEVVEMIRAAKVEA